MEIDHLFDELEHEFADKSYQWNKQVNCLKIQLSNKNSFDLLAPIVGVDFVAGLDKQNADWYCIALVAIANIQPVSNSDDELPLLRKQSINFLEFINTLDRPVRVVATFADQSESAFNLLDVQEQFVIAESSKLIPLQAIQQIRVLGTNSWA
jgi:hypothetical protein